MSEFPKLRKVYESYKNECLDLSGIPGLTNQEFHDIIIKFKSLKHLNLFGCYLLTDDIQGQFTHFFANLKTFNNRGCTELTDNFTSFVVKNSPVLENLVTDVRFLDQDAVSETFATSNKQLTNLDVSLLNEPNIDMRHVFDRICPQLTIIRATNLVFEDLLVSIVNFCGTLKEIDLSHCQLLTDSLLTTIINRNLETLLTVILNGCSAVTDNGALALCKCKSLSRLDLSGLAITDKTMIDIPKNCRDLIHLSVNNCTKVTDVGLKLMLRNKKQRQPVQLLSFCDSPNVKLTLSDFATKSDVSLVLIPLSKEISTSTFVYSDSGKKVTREARHNTTVLTCNALTLHAFAMRSKLRSITLHAIPDLDDETFAVLLTHCSKLTSVNLHDNMQLTALSVTLISTKIGKKLKRIELSPVPADITDEVVIALCEDTAIEHILFAECGGRLSDGIVSRICHASLLSFTMTNCTLLSDDGATLLIEKCTALTVLNLSGCTRLTSRVLWAIIRSDHNVIETLDLRRCPLLVSTDCTDFTESLFYRNHECKMKDFKFNEMHAPHAL